MAKKNKSSVYRTPPSKVQNDTKFYIKFKDPRSKSLIFYYFHEEDIFDPCILLNHGDVVADSSVLDIPQQKAKPTTPVAKTATKNINSAPVPPPVKPKSPLSPQLEETLQVKTANIVPMPKKSPQQKKSPIYEELEDVGYMTAMDLHFDPGELDDPEEEEEEYQILEEVIEPAAAEKKINLTHMRTAIEAIRSDEQDYLIPIKISKEEFNKHNNLKDCPEYKIWAENHLSKNNLNARAVSPAEFRLLKKVIGLKR